MNDTELKLECLWLVEKQRQATGAAYDAAAMIVEAEKLLAWLAKVPDPIGRVASKHAAKRSG
jgi:hypothetical protein